MYLIFRQKLNSYRIIRTQECHQVGIVSHNNVDTVLNSKQGEGNADVSLLDREVFKLAEVLIKSEIK